MSEFFPPIDKWQLDEAVLSNSFSDMRIDGELGNEGSCLWLGKRINGGAIISRVVALRGAGITKQPAFLHVTDELMFEVAELASAHDEVILAQIHSHGPGYGVDLSHTDHRYGIRVPHFVSIVAPDYAHQDVPLIDCGVHVFEPEFGYRRFKSVEVEQRFVFGKSHESSFVIVGGEHV
jgi:hypothetical protein